jgi:hypothetical protein
MIVSNGISIKDQDFSTDNAALKNVRSYSVQPQSGRAEPSWQSLPPEDASQAAVTKDEYDNWLRVSRVDWHPTAYMQSPFYPNSSAQEKVCDGSIIFTPFFWFIVTARSTFVFLTATGHRKWAPIHVLLDLVSHELIGSGIRSVYQYEDIEEVFNTQCICTTSTSNGE